MYPVEDSAQDRAEARGASLDRMVVEGAAERRDRVGERHGARTRAGGVARDRHHHRGAYAQLARAAELAEPHLERADLDAVHPYHLLRAEPQESAIDAKHAARDLRNQVGVDVTHAAQAAAEPESGGTGALREGARDQRRGGRRDEQEEKETGARHTPQNRQE